MILGPLHNHLRIPSIDHLAHLVIPKVVLENDLKIHVFLVAVESAVASAVASAVESVVASAVDLRFKDPAKNY